jgi:hypothetical protein
MSDQPLGEAIDVWAYCTQAKAASSALPVEELLDHRKGSSCRHHPASGSTLRYADVFPVARAGTVAGSGPQSGTAARNAALGIKPVMLCSA